MFKKSTKLYLIVYSPYLCKHTVIIEAKDEFEALKKLRRANKLHGCIDIYSIEEYHMK